MARPWPPPIVICPTFFSVTLVWHRRSASIFSKRVGSMKKGKDFHNGLSKPAAFFSAAMTSSNAIR